MSRDINLVLILISLFLFTFYSGCFQVSEGEQNISWQVTESPVGFEGKFNAIYFVDERSGWIGGDTGLFRTDDSGKSWKRVVLETPNNSEITHLYFSDLLYGWVIIQTIFSTSPENEQFWIMSTEDGGLTWKLQFSMKEVWIADMKFSTSKSGWAIGAKRTSTSCQDSLLINYNGENWQAKNSFSDINTKIENSLCNDIPTSLVVNEKNEITIITNGRKVIQSVNSGHSWQLKANYQDNDAQARVYASGINDNQQIWFVEGANSIEGTRGKLMVEGNRTFLFDSFFTDAVYLLNNEFIVCGTDVKSIYNKNSGKYHEKKEALIVYTNNNGKSWKEVYRNPNFETIVSLSLIKNSNYHLWGISSDGFVIHLENK